MGYFENLFKHIRHKNIEVLAIGEKFPWEGYNDLGDHVSVALNEASLTYRNKNCRPLVLNNLKFSLQLQS